LRVANDLDIHAVVPSGSKKLGIERAGFWSMTGFPTFFTFDEKQSKWDEIKMRAYVCETGEVTSSFNCTTGLKNKRGEDIVVKNKGRQFSLYSFPNFLNEDEAYVFGRLVSPIKSIEGSEKIQLFVTRDGGSHWVISPYSLPNDYCHSLIAEVSDRLLVSCNGATGEFFESLDKGKTWIQVREQGVF
jgi:hypothetical protein